MSDSLFADAMLPRRAREVLPGVVHIPGWLTLEQQLFMVREFQRIAREGIPVHSPEIYGKKMSVELTTLGWHWSNYRYMREAPEFKMDAVPPLPQWMVKAGRSALADAYRPEVALGWPGLRGDELSGWAQDYTPDMALINYYSPQASMGMHQDKEERSSAPVVSLSIGDTALFRVGNTEHRNKPYTDFRLASGDLVVFGGPSRFMFHGVPRIEPGTMPYATDFARVGLTEGRFNLTLRYTGLTPLEEAGLPLA